MARSLPVEIFPTVDVGRFQIRLKAPTGTRIERTEQFAKQTLAAINELAGEDAVDISVGYVGLIPSSYPINAIHQWTGGPEEALIRDRAEGQVAASDVGRPQAVAPRASLASELPDVRFSFEPADIVSDVMSFGSPTPVEVALAGPNFAETREHAEKVRAELAKIPGLRDLQYAQAQDYPALRIEIDRERAGLANVTAEEIARSVVTATSSSRFVVPNYWPDPKSGIGYQVQVEIPYAAMDTIRDLETIPIQRIWAAAVAPERRGHGRPWHDARRVRPLQHEANRLPSPPTSTAATCATPARRSTPRSQRAGEPPKGVMVDVRGQIAPMREILSGLSIGLVAAVLAILLLLTASFQSVGLALVVISTLPAVLCGVAAGAGLDRHDDQHPVLPGRHHGARAWPWPTPSCWSPSPNDPEINRRLSPRTPPAWGPGTACGRSS